MRDEEGNTWAEKIVACDEAKFHVEEGEPTVVFTTDDGKKISWGSMQFGWFAYDDGKPLRIRKPFENEPTPSHEEVFTPKPYAI